MRSAVMRDTTLDTRVKDFLAQHRIAVAGVSRNASHHPVGNLIHARGVIEALAAGTIDVGPLDSYYHDLLRHNEPAFAQQVRTLASTETRPIPPLVATAALKPGELARLREALQASMKAPELRDATERLLLAAFATPDPGDYDVLAQIARSHLPNFEEL